VNNHQTPTSALIYLCANCRQPFSTPDHDDGDGEDYCPNPDCGEKLVPDENWLDADDVESVSAELRGAVSS
jgi:hypothetical protein